MNEIFSCHSSVKIQQANTTDEWYIDKCGYGNLGLNFVAPFYIQVNEIQDRDYEYAKIMRALEKYKEHYSQKHSIDIANLHFHFINWGRTELVYVLKNGDDICETVLIKQPGVRMGTVEKEAQNLTELKKRDEHVVAPLEYFQIGDQELYTTPYMWQARCIAADSSWWGMYIPEPMYRFECFQDNVVDMVCIGMIAKLVSLYDHQKQMGIGACRLSGGDFMFPKDWDTKEITMNSILENLYLIAAREMISCPFEEYLNIIRREFRKYTIDNSQEQAIINVRGRAIMSKEVIEKGIQLGIEITPKEENYQNPKQYQIEPNPQ